MGTHTHAHTHTYTHIHTHTRTHTHTHIQHKQQIAQHKHAHTWAFTLMMPHGTCGKSKPSPFALGMAAYSCSSFKKEKLVHGL